jgi:hypothetical protein
MLRDREKPLPKPALELTGGLLRERHEAQLVGLKGAPIRPRAGEQVQHQTNQGVGLPGARTGQEP